ncbi:MarR family winged helix-turn-helix transcriptional regulator [Rhizobium sp. SSA_523]|uniref:MarR family winged helix-turn-helix transcriptional regulator n=1 Tax=Rhizobium sp. SSA_523 TaxID=2952477 RepID=UPI0020919F8E|nr:MarR family winged helix-turn-helix transcriptional regulator [Rhizobium sp. SSA_523]MCO5733194.1 MarR family winged helix-turn-helix transcriptional regulator [Rhizobium sp. SSA_523]WKC21815.1 MarR family winged helix-turn-helix transcriptional regulator [Rhizobium sp. SSA_523]
MEGEVVETGEELEQSWLKGLLGYHLRMAHLALYRDFAAHMAAFDLTQKQLAALELIATNPGASQVDIANALSMDRATMMGVVKRLMARGLVERRPSAVDRRRHEMRLSEAGSTMLAEVHGIIDQHEDAFSSVLSQGERRELIRLLRRLYERS